MCEDALVGKESLFKAHSELDVDLLVQLCLRAGVKVVAGDASLGASLRLDVSLLRLV